MGGTWGLSPRESLRAECDRRGSEQVVALCVDLVEGRAVEDDFLLALAGPHAALVLSGRAGGPSGYWPRVWGTRGLLHVWDACAASAVVGATLDDAWRVREMACKVVARQEVGDALSAVARLRSDPVARVRAAAERAVVAVTAAGA